MMVKTIATLTLLTLSFSTFAVGPPAPMTKAEFDDLMQDISNWGRWGKQCELGTLNLN